MEIHEKIGCTVESTTRSMGSVALRNTKNHTPKPRTTAWVSGIPGTPTLAGSCVAVHLVGAATLQTPCRHMRLHKQPQACWPSCDDPPRLLKSEMTCKGWGEGTGGRTGAG